jgi:hypothetical protein
MGGPGTTGRKLPKIPRIIQKKPRTSSRISIGLYCLLVALKCLKLHILKNFGIQPKAPDPILEAEARRIIER